MKAIFFIFCLITYGVSSHSERVKEEVVTYVGAVFEYEPYKVWDDDEKGYGVIRRNAEVVTSTVRIAKLQGADIFVNPEYGLTSINSDKSNFTALYTYMTYVPDPKDSVVPCDATENHPNVEGLKILSCTAREESIYLAINMLEANPCSLETVASAPWSEYNTYESYDNCPESGFYIHNTEIILDRTGAVIIRYRKQHPFIPNEDYLTPGPMNDNNTSIFMSDFNVPFTVQICFDMDFRDPAYNNVKNYGIKDVIESTAWVDYLPFYIGDTVQNAWSRGMDINFLISGHHYPEFGKLGSGIYRQLFDLPPVYIFDKDSGNVLLIAEINTTVSTTTTTSSIHEKPLQNNRKRTQDKIIYLSDEVEGRNHTIVYEDLENHSRVTLPSGELGEILKADVCNVDNFCCNLTYQYTGDLTYMLLSHKGQTNSSIEWYLGIQNCAIIWCETDNITTCAHVEMGLPKDDEFGPFTLSTSSFTIDSIFPGGLHRNFSLVNNDDLHYNVDEKTYSFNTTKPIKNLLVVSLLGRWYDNDTFYNITKINY